MRFWRLAAICLGLVVVGLGSPDRSSAGETVYTVGGISVDVTAEAAAQAREQAIAEGHVKAFSALIERIVLEEDQSRVARLSARDIETYVLGFSVADERTSDVRYLAELTFRFKPKAVRALLIQQGLRFTETRSKPWVVLAVQSVAERPQLWEEPNPWRQAWQARRTLGDLVPLLAPVGDLADLAAIDAERALGGNPTVLAAIARRYGAEQALVSHARLDGDPSAGSARLVVANTRFVDGRLTPPATTTYAQGQDETPERLYGRAAEAVARELARDWKRANVIEFQNRGAIQASVPIDSFAEWLAVRQRLDQVPLIELVTVTSLRRSKAELDIDYYGGEQQLTTALAQQNLLLTRSFQDGWQISFDPATRAQIGQ